MWHALEIIRHEDAISNDTVHLLMNIPSPVLSVLSLHCRMSQEEKAGSLSITSEAVSSAMEAGQRAPVAAANVRTLQDVQDDIGRQKALYDQAMAKYEAALTAYEAALDAWKKDPPNEVLSKELAGATKLMDSRNNLTSLHAQRLASLETECAQLQAAANASSEQKSEYSTELLADSLPCHILPNNSLTSFSVLSSVALLYYPPYIT